MNRNLPYSLLGNDCVFLLFIIVVLLLFKSLFEAIIFLFSTYALVLKSWITRAIKLFYSYFLIEIFFFYRFSYSKILTYHSFHISHLPVFFIKSRSLFFNGRIARVLSRL